ncbi:MAG: CpaF family protein [Firmicutes bacterium]|nr:CpaF family protein [Bacillota bacterium]
MEVHRRLNERLGTGEVEILCEEPGGSEDTPEGRAKVEEAIACILAELGGIDADREERRSLTEEISREVLGLGHLEEFLRNPEITEIMVNGPSQVYVERHGRLELTDKAFLNEAQLHRIVERIIAPLGRRIDESSPMVDARLPDGSRLNAVIKPIAINGPVVTIRKFAARPFTMRDLIDMGTLSEPMADFLRACVISRKNIVISGGTGSGKTTLLNVLSGFIPGDERIVTIEDSAELQLHQQHVCRLEARPPNTEGKGAVTIRQMVRNALRMRPNRIIVGEVRGEEALDMLQALNTGHHGSLTTAHANSPRDLILRLETMVLLAGIDLPLRAIREQISGAVDVVVHQTRFRDGSRKVMAVVEVGDQGGGVVQLKDVFVYRQEPGLDDQGRVRGSFLSTGALPDCLEDFAVHGVPLPPELFAGVLETSTTLH